MIYLLSSSSAFRVGRHMQYFTASQDVKAIKKTFIVHGESSAQEAMKDHLYEAGFRNIHIPQKGASVVL